MNAAKRILASKKITTVFTIGPDATVYDAVKLMAEKGIGALLVTEGERVAGIVTERDYARKIILMGRASRETRVNEIMTAKVLYVHHLPVLDGDRLVGMLSIGDLVKDIISDRACFGSRGSCSACSRG